MIDKNKIEMLLALDFPLQRDPYADSVYELIKPPKWIHPIKRFKYIRTLRKRTHLILAEYAREIITNIQTKSEV